MNLTVSELSDEVLVNQDAIAVVDRSDIEILKRRARLSRRGRARLCVHRSVEEAIHEMLIVHTKGSYIQPHKHPGKTVSYHVIDGELDLVIFEDDGTIVRAVKMGPHSSGLPFYWRLSKSLYYSVLPLTNMVVFNEVVNGPWERATSFIGAPWSPDESDDEGASRFMESVRCLIHDHRMRKKHE